MWTIGLDVHWRTTSVCILNEYGKKIKAKTLRGPWEKVISYLAGLSERFQVCFEASCGYGALYDRLRPLSARVVVAHPGQVRMIFRAKRKNDRVDAQKLAQLLYLDAVPPAYVPGVGTRQWRRMIELRRTLIAKRVRTKNGLRALLRSHGIRAPRSLWIRKGLQWLRQVAFAGEMPAIERDLLLEELAQYDQQIRRVTRTLDRIARRHSGGIHLRDIPGVGPRTAEAILAYMDDPRRFGSKQVGAYFGLVPCQDASAGTNRLGHITREGPATARKLLVEAAWQAIRRCPHVRTYFERICGGKKDRRKIALAATAHYLLRCMHAMLRTGECWRYPAHPATGAA